MIKLYDFFSFFSFIFHFTGGWMMIGNITINKPEDVSKRYFPMVKSDSLKSLQNVPTGAFVLSREVVDKLNKIIQIKEIRIKCYKQYHGRKMHIKFISERAIKNLIMQKPSKMIKLKLAEDFVFLGDDNSLTRRESYF